jgi:hypothetical protein
MISQIRLYTINRGMMDSWVNVFKEKLIPIHKKCGIPVERAWFNLDKSEFIWVRSFSSIDEIPIKEAEYFDTPERKALGALPGSHIAKVEVRVVESVDLNSI